MEQCMILAQNNNTPVPYWLSRPLWELRDWIRINNVVISKREGKPNGQS